MAVRHTGGRLCECRLCTMKRIQIYDEKVRLMWKPRMPESIDQVVPVRAHFRRQPNYANKLPAFKDLVVQRVKKMVGGTNEG